MKFYTKKNLEGIWKRLQKLSRQWEAENYSDIEQELISSHSAMGG